MDQPTQTPVSLLERPEEPVESKTLAASSVSFPSNVKEQLGNILSTLKGANCFRKTRTEFFSLGTHAFV